MKLVPGGIRLGQVGTFGGVGPLPLVVKKSVDAKVGRAYTVRVALHTDGQVEVFLEGKRVLRHQFPAPVAGAVGVGALKNGAQFDDVIVRP